MAFTIQLFGDIEVRGNQVKPSLLASRRTRWLLALLILRRRGPVEREWLAATLWPDSDTPQALYNLRRALSTLRAALGPDEAGRLVSSTPRTLILDLHDGECDLCAFDAAVHRGDREALEAAVSLYRGPLLDGCDEVWALGERRERAAKYLSALETLAESGTPEAVVRAFRHLVAADPSRASARRALMTALADLGDYAAAVQVYRDFRLFLHESLHSIPDAETAALYNSLKEAGRQAGQAARVIQKETTVPSPKTPCHLPTPLTNLIGREAAIERVAALLESSRLVTLTGAGGVGKTRLAVAAAHHLHEEFADGAWFADLAPLPDPEKLTAALISTFDLHEEPGCSSSEALIAFLRPRRLLLVFDNCEHLVSSCARLARTLLEDCPGLHILATSREHLGVTGEVQWRVPSLSLPDGRGDDPRQCAAFRLFVERASQAIESFALSPQTQDVVLQICRRLDGIPLAIEMAAARTRAMTVTQIAARLDAAFHLLCRPGGDQVPRHQTLRATMDWSWDLLGNTEKTLLRRLCVFAGGWVLEAAEEVCAGGVVEQWAALDLLTSLVDKSLVVYEEEAGGRGRYRLLETVRQYARDRLAESGETEEMQERHRNHFLQQAEMHPEDGTWFQGERDNLRAALTFSLEEEEDAEAALRLGTRIGWHCYRTGEMTEGRGWLDRVLDKDGESCSQERMEALHAASFLAMQQADHARAEALAKECLRLAKQLGDEGWQYAPLIVLGHVVSDLKQAQEFIEQRVAFQRRPDNEAELADALADLGMCILRQGDPLAARPILEEAASLALGSGSSQSIEYVRSIMPHLARVEGDWETASTLMEAELALHRDRGNPLNEAFPLRDLGVIRLHQGDLEAADALISEAVPLFELSGNPGGLIRCLEGFAQVVAARGRWTRSACIFGAAERQREMRGLPLPPVDRVDYDAVPSVHAAMGEEAFTRAWMEGRAMTLDQAVEYALEAGATIEAS